MRVPKSAYELRESQVNTPPPVISLVWKLVRDRRRKRVDRVLDLGAGDARFAQQGHYNRYDGVEIDPQTCRNIKLPKNARIVRKCAFRLADADYDACIGNPPYVRHHDIESPWRERTAERIEKQLGVKLSPRGNLYLYFLCLALLKTKMDGLVALVMPFEWVSRPSATAVRHYIEKMKWNVSVYRFQDTIFDDVLTTAAVTIIDKRKREGIWEYFDILTDLQTQPRKGISGNRTRILQYSKRGKVWARRGISPGGQKTFALTEQERIEAGLWLCDVLPCVTTLKQAPRELAELNAAAFKKYFIDAGERCWLIKSASKHLSARIRKYLDGVPADAKTTYACRHQRPWYKYETPPIPLVLFHSGFTKRGPKVLVNAIGAQAAGSVYGINSSGRDIGKRAVRNFLANFNFERCVVAHARVLKKVEVAQLNSVLTTWTKARRHGRKAAR